MLRGHIISGLDQHFSVKFRAHSNNFLDGAPTCENTVEAIHFINIITKSET